MNYQIQGLSIHAEVHGTAEPALVFLHYWGGTSRTWRQVTAELEGRFKTVAYDARGWGKSDKTLVGYKLADLAEETSRPRSRISTFQRCCPPASSIRSIQSNDTRPRRWLSRSH